MTYVHSLMKRVDPGLLVLVVLLGLLVAVTQPAQAQTLTTLYNFGSQTGDGVWPRSSLIMDKKGNLYGTTPFGGTGSSPACNMPSYPGCGTAFKLAPPGKKGSSWTETVLYNFGSQYEYDVYPAAGLIMDAERNLYGTTTGGDGAGGAQGTVFELTPTGVETVLHAFTGEPEDGSAPTGQLIMDAQGNFYGTTTGGGPGGNGTVFKLAPDGAETLLHGFGFQQPGDGCTPYAGVIMDKKGNLYGTTWACGAYGYGTVFMVAPNGTETVLYNFNPYNGTDGFYPVGGVVIDKKGNLYGTTTRGGASCDCGTVFKLTPGKKGGAWTEILLHSFGNQSGDGSGPQAGLIMDKEGNLYGTTEFAGGGYDGGRGTVFKLSPTGTEAWLYSFCTQGGCPDGAYPYASLIMDKKGNLYSTTDGGGTYGYGTVFKLTP